MKVILIKDLNKKQKKDSIIDVNSGYAYNYLLPKKIAVEYTPENITELNFKKTTQKIKENKEIQKSLEIKKLLEKEQIKFKLRFENNHTYGSITPKQIVNELNNLHNLQLKHNQITENENIREIGSSTIEIKIHKDIIAKINVVVEKEDGHK